MEPASLQPVQTQDSRGPIRRPDHCIRMRTLGNGTCHGRKIWSWRLKPYVQYNTHLCHSFICKVGNQRFNHNTVSADKVSMVQPCPYANHAATANFFSKTQILSTSSTELLIDFDQFTIY
uniref:Uncharacterized protein n=1 Tax=Oryza nivara TaxID=4536 RepID=A0A0E0GNB0_ORYNI